MRLAPVILIAALLVGGASAQITTAVCAVDVTNRVISEADALPRGLLLGKIRNWYPFAATSTNVDFGLGDAAPSRNVMVQSNATFRPVHTNGAFRFDGSDDRLESRSIVTQMCYGYAVWINLASNVTATNGPGGTVISDQNAASPANMTSIGIGSFTGATTGETAIMYANQLNTYMVACTSTLVAGWHHIAGLWAGTNWDIYVDGALANHVRSSNVPGTSPAVTNRGNIWVGAIGRSTNVFFNGTVGDIVVPSAQWTAADVGAAYTAGVRRLGL